VDNRPDRDVLTAGLVQGVDQRKRYHIGGGANYLLSEKAALDLSYDYNQDDWDTNVSEREDLTVNVANLGFTYNLGGWLETATGSLNLGYANYDYETSEIDSFFGGVGFQHMLSEIFSFKLDLGARYVESEFDVQNGFDFVPGVGFVPRIEQESNSGWGGVGTAILEYRGEKTRSSFLASHDLSAVSGRQGPTQLTRIIGSINHRLLEDLRLGFTAGFYRNKADEGDFSSREIEEYTFRLRPSIRWEFYENFTLEGAYTYVYVKNEVTDRDTTRNDIYAQLAYGLPLFDFLDLFSAEGRQVLSGAVPVTEPR
jgi:opacity protein-like surface antigen